MALWKSGKINAITLTYCFEHYLQALFFVVVVNLLTVLSSLDKLNTSESWLDAKPSMYINAYILLILQVFHLIRVNVFCKCRNCNHDNCEAKAQIKITVKFFKNSRAPETQFLLNTK